MQKRQTRQSGFTLVELIIVIIILGILAAIALPKYIQLQVQARIAKLNALHGTVQEASILAHGLTLALGNVQNTPITMENQAVTMLNFYPTADTPGIMSAVGNYAVVANQTADGIVVVAGPGANQVTIELLGATVPGNTCAFTYQNNVLGAAPVISAVATAGC